MSLGDAQLVQIGADIVEHRDEIIGVCQQEELVRRADAILQQDGGRITVGIDLDRIDGDAGGLDVGAGAQATAGLIHTVVDRRLVSVPALLSVQSIRKQDDGFLVPVVGIFCRRRERSSVVGTSTLPDTVTAAPPSAV